MAVTRTQRLWIALGILGAIVVAGFGAAYLMIRGGGDAPPPDPRDAAVAFLDAWQGRRWPRLQSMVVGAPAVAPVTYQAQLDGLGADRVRVRLLSGKGNTRNWRGRFEASLRILDAGTITYSGDLALVLRRGKWKVLWTPATVHPKLPANGSFAVERVFPPRAPILAVDSTPLTVDTQVVDVGLVPERIKDRPALEDALQRTLDVDPADVEAKLNAPGVQPSFFVLITTVPVSRYDAVRDEIYPLPGTAFRRRTSRGAVTDQLGAHVVGRIGPATAEILHELGPDYRDTDTVGLSGLERVYEQRLAGTPGRRFVIRDAQGTTVDTLKDLPGTPGQPVRTTIDLRTQQAAEAALANAPEPAALVALQPSTGELRAIVSTPVDVEFDRALDGRYPPGSTFKIVTTAALLANGVTPATETTCPPTYTIDGRAFRNFEGEAEPSLSFGRAFAISCNTAFLQLGEKLPDQAMKRAATMTGFDAKPALPLAAVGGSMPDPTTATERAAATIGQGKVTASPLTMATVAGAVGAGTWNPSKLVLDPAPKPGEAARPLDPGIVASLRSLMADVVANGTGTEAAAGGRQVSGKTGTAEFGDGENPPTHAWFVGFSGDLAFSVLVEGGGVGGRVAAPIASRFLRAVP
jgi:cell division protein FtsI/penicillin-binding protein 2